jgi:hypothetical protein
VLAPADGMDLKCIGHVSSGLVSRLPFICYLTLLFSVALELDLKLVYSKWSFFRRNWEIAINQMKSLRLPQEPPAIIESNHVPGLPVLTIL